MTPAYAQNAADTSVRGASDAVGRCTLKTSDAPELRGGFMSYMRGTCYIWGDDHHVHVWVEDGYDGWDESSWADGRSKPSDSAQDERASGVGVPHAAMDAFVVMRLAELVAEQRAGTVIEAAVAQFGGNGGCLALQKLATALVRALEPVSSEPGALEMRDLWKSARGD